MLKSSSVKRHQADIIRIESENEYSRDGAVLYFAEGSTGGFDKGDSEKYFNESERIPEVYTRIGAKAMAINGLPALVDDSCSIPLSVQNRITGDVTLKFDLTAFTANYDLVLEDKEADTFIDLSETNTHSYSVDKVGTNHDRFVIHLKSNQGGDETQTPDENEDISTGLQDNDEETTDAQSAIRITSISNKVLVSVDMELVQKEAGVVEVYTVDGYKISEVPAPTSRTLIILPEISGVYIIHARFSSQVKSKKVIGFVN